jgi:hypothetical protein
VRGPAIVNNTARTLERDETGASVLIDDAFALAVSGGEDHVVQQVADVLRLLAQWRRTVGYGSDELEDIAQALDGGDGS